ncbi:lectin, partial [Mycena vitilis]
STWIWTNEVTTPGGAVPVGSRALRKDWTAPLGKTPVQADVILTVDNGLTLYVNGGQVGSGSVFTTAERFCVALRPCLNVFTVTGVNSGGPAGLLAAIEVTYSDGTTDTIVSDTTWRAFNSVPDGYEQLSFDDNSWTPAIPEGKHGVAPWGQITIPATAPVLSLSDATWIWTSEVANGVAPAGARAFRRTYTPGTDQTATSATIQIVADNEYTLYVNGILVGSGTDFHQAQTYNVNLSPAPKVVIAVYAVNTDVVNNPAGVLASVQIKIADCECTSGVSFITDASWKAHTGIPPIGFEQPGYDDSAWPAATVEGPYGMAPWGKVPVSP